MEFAIRKAADRGHVQTDWLDTWHTFSFADYHDPRYVNFSALRVINEDRVKAGTGFGMHPHRNMEIITYLISGSLEHKDSMGNGSVIKPGDVQYMSAGTGVLHSEVNPSSDEDVHLLQIWILPDAKNTPPTYGQINVPVSAKRDRFCLVASNTGENGAMGIRQDVQLYASVISAGKELEYTLARERNGWLQIVRGDVMFRTSRLHGGDGVGMMVGDHEAQVTLRADAGEAEVLFFDLP